MQNMRGIMNLSCHTKWLNEQSFNQNRLLKSATAIAFFILAACSQTTQPVDVSISVAKPGRERVAIKNLHVHTSDMDVLITKRVENVDLSGLKIWRENGWMKASFLIINNRSDPVNLKDTERWLDQNGKSIDGHVDERTLVVAASRAQTILISAPVLQAQRATVELVEAQ
jgi:uncharacterized protein YcfL